VTLAEKPFVGNFGSKIKDVHLAQSLTSNKIGFTAKGTTLG